MASDSVNFVDENNAGRILFALFEQIADSARANAHKHFNEVGTGNRKEWNVGLARNSAREQGFPSAWRTDEQDPLRNAPAQFLEFLRVLQKFDNFLELFLCFVGAGDVLEGGLLLLRREQPGA